MFDGKQLIATNGRILAVVPVTEAEGDVPGLVSRKALVQATKNRTNGRPDAVIHLPDAFRELAHSKDGVLESARPEEMRFPDYQAVVPTPDDGLEIILSAEQLANVIAALGVKGSALDWITLKFTAERGKANEIVGIDGGSPVLVQPSAEGNQAYGVIMPISAD